MSVDAMGFPAQGGGTITSWASTTNTITATTTNPTKGTIVIDKIYWRRVGDSMHCRVDYQQSSAGTAGIGKYLFLIPDGKTIDTTKIRLSPNAFVVLACVGSGAVSDTTSYARQLYPSVYDTTHMQIGDSTGYVGNTNGSLGSTNMCYTFEFTVPIVEWA